MFATPEHYGDSQCLDATDAMDSGNNSLICLAYNDQGAAKCPFIFGIADRSKCVVMRNQNYFRFHKAASVRDHDQLYEATEIPDL